MRFISMFYCVMLLAVIPATGLRADDAPAAKSVTVFDAALSVPAAFKPVQAKSSIIEHEFQVSGEGDDVARLTFMPSGGGVQPNIDRWKGQFAGGKAEDQKVDQIKAGNWTIHLVELSGTFKETMGGGPFSGGKVVERTNYGMLGAILEHPEGRLYFVKLVGSEDILKKNRDAFIEMVKSLK